MWGVSPADIRASRAGLFPEAESPGRLHRAAAALQKGPLAVRCIFNGDYIKGCDVIESIMEVNIFCAFQ